MIPVPMVAATCRTEHREGDEVEKRRPGHGITRRQHAGGNDGGDGIGRVMQAIEKVEDQGDGDQGRKKEHQTCSMTMPLMRLATSSKRSTTFSRWS
jgi:hypothetical protein